jgi:hypothetical protein
MSYAFAKFANNTVGFSFPTKLVAYSRRVIEKSRIRNEAGYTCGITFQKMGYRLPDSLPISAKLYKTTIGNVETATVKVKLTEELSPEKFIKTLALDRIESLFWIYEETANWWEKNAGAFNFDWIPPWIIEEDEVPYIYVAIRGTGQFMKTDTGKEWTARYGTEGDGSMLWPNRINDLLKSRPIKKVLEYLSADLNIQYDQRGLLLAGAGNTVSVYAYSSAWKKEYTENDYPWLAKYRNYTYYLCETNLLPYLEKTEKEGALFTKLPHGSVVKISVLRSTSKEDGDGIGFNHQAKLSDCRDIN